MRIDNTSSRSLAGSRSSCRIARRSVSNAAPTVASPAQKRARVSAWCSHTQADSRWYLRNASIELTRRPLAPSGRSLRSVSNSTPAGVRLVSQLFSRCARRA